MQLFGSEPDLMAEVAKSIEERPFDILDINMGCPVPKVVNNGEGSALLKDPQLIEEIVRSVSGAVSKPVTVKVRIGFDENTPVDVVEIAKRGGGCRCSSHRSSWKDQTAVLFRSGGLGCYPQGEGSGDYSGDRKRRYRFTGNCRSHV